MASTSQPNALGKSPAASSRSSPHFVNQDIGSPQLAGSAIPMETGWDVLAGGVDIWENADQFHFVFKEVTGDFDFAVRVERFEPAHLYSKAGLMIRENLTAESAHLMFLVFPTNESRNNNLGGYEMQFRPAAGTGCHAIYPVVRPPAPPEFPATYPNCWLRVARRENQFLAFASTDGTEWKLYAQQVLSLLTTVKLGLALTSHNAQVMAHAAFRNYTEYHGESA